MQTVIINLRDNWLIFVLLVFLTIVSWRSINYVSHRGPSQDSAVYASGSMHLLHNKILYRDIWDHKPPMIYLLDTLALWIGDKTINSIHVLEQVFAVLGGLLFFTIIMRVFKNQWLAFFAALFFLVHFYNPSAFQGGNYAEEYAPVFVMAGIISTLFAKPAEEKLSFVLSFIAGILFSLAILTKEPFLFSSVPWFLYLIVFKQEGKWRVCFSRGGYFVLGALIPLVFVLAYLVPHGALGDWIDIFSYNINYVRLKKTTSFFSTIWRNCGPIFHIVIDLTLTGKVLFLFGLVSAIWNPFLKKHDYFPMVVVLAFIMEHYATSMSGRYYGHYYLQIIPSFVMLTACGTSFLIYLIGKLKQSRQLNFNSAALVVPIAILLTISDYNFYKAQATLLARPSRRAVNHPISEYIKQHTSNTDFIWAVGLEQPRFYLETGLLSPTKYFFVLDHLFIDTNASSRKEKIALIRLDLKKKPPKFIIAPINFYQGLINKNKWIKKWINSNYTKLPITQENAQLYIIKKSS